MSLSRLFIAAAAVGALSAPGAARADCVDCSCGLSSSGLVFGAYNPRRPSTNSVGVIHVTCSGDSGYTIKLSPGSSGTATTRTVYSGANALNYNLFKDASRTMIWGDGSAGYTGVGGAGTGNYNIYGGLFGGQTALVGTYLDTIVVSIEY